MYLYSICIATGDIPGSTDSRFSFFWPSSHEISSQKDLNEIENHIVERIYKETGYHIERFSYLNFSLVSSSFKTSTSNSHTDL